LKVELIVFEQGMGVRICFLSRAHGESTKSMLNNASQEYHDYAIHCLELAKGTIDRSSRVFLREMAAKWLRLAAESETNGRTGG
jgi:chromosome segregation and condensation protein ScpB